MIATRLAGKRAGLIAALMTALCPALVSRGSNVVVDTFATFFVVLTLFFCERLRESPRLTSTALAGFTAGLAFASKYPAGAVVIVIVAMIWTLPVTRSARVRFTLVATLGFFGGIALGAPATIVKLPAVAHDLAITTSHYRVIHSSPGYLGQAVMASELGWVLALVGIGGVVIMVRRAPTRSTALSWCAFALLLLAPLVGRPFQPFRNLLGLVPPFCVAAAIALSQLFDWAREGAQRRLRVGVTVAILAGCATSLAFASFQALRQRMADVDTRIQAIDWLQQHSKKNERVLALRELAILPAEWEKIEAASTIVPWSEAANLLEREQFDYVISGELDPRSPVGLNRLPVDLTHWKQKTAPLPVQAEFGSVVTPVVPYLWRTNNQRILILRGKLF
jgi:4-amino-4-deoxy-L-arabinose transferase-like glycosyltransferase